MMPVRALRVSRYRPEARADGRIRTALATLAGPGVVLAFFVWVATVASRRYGHGSWPRSDVGGIGYTVNARVTWSRRCSY